MTLEKLTLEKFGMLGRYQVPYRPRYLPILHKFCKRGVRSMFDKRYKANKGLSDYEILMHLANDFVNMANKLADIQSREENV